MVLIELRCIDIEGEYVWIVGDFEFVIVCWCELGVGWKYQYVGVYIVGNFCSCEVFFVVVGNMDCLVVGDVESGCIVWMQVCLFVVVVFFGVV